MSPAGTPLTGGVFVSGFSIELKPMEAWAILHGRLKASKVEE